MDSPYEPSRDTICALATAPGRAAIAMVRVSGPGVRRAIEALAGRLPEARRATLTTIRGPSSGQDIDRCIVLFYPGPSSFTGEDVVEILLHGGKAVVARVLAELQALECRLAEPGEFARRAFENGKIDLTAAEGIADLIDAETEAQRRQAVAQAGGVLHQLYDGWREELLDAMALTEAGIDFSDEADVAADATARARQIAVALHGRINAHLQDGRRGEILRDGFRVVLAGAPNAGKSSLLNALARRDAAIVSPEAGTTRDVIEVRLDLNGYPVIVSDTAGIRSASGAVEREGMRRAIEQGCRADLVLWVIDATLPIRDIPQELKEGAARIWLLMNKVDLFRIDEDQRAAIRSARTVEFIGGDDGDGNIQHRVSATTGEGMAELISLIAAEARQRIAPDEGPVITQARHRAALEDCAKCLQDYLVLDIQQVELAAEDLRRAANALGRIIGKVDAEEVLGAIFGRFCIGK